MNERIYTLLRAGRSTLQTLLEPLDLAARMLNNKHNYPPLKLRQAVGNLSDFEGSAAEYVAYLKLLCGLKPGDLMLDLGCGCATILAESTEQTLLDFLGGEGGYIGLDNDLAAIKWNYRRLICSSSEPEKPTLAFHSISTEEKLPLLDESVNVALCKSLFTHLYPTEIERYLQEIYRVLKPGGKCLATFFILDNHPPKGRYTFRYSSRSFSWERESKPRLAIAYQQAYLTSALPSYGFSFQLYPGSWNRSKQPGLSFQDIIILTKESGSSLPALEED